MIIPWQIGLVSMLFLVLLITGAILIFGPIGFVGNLMFLTGWMIVKTGIPILGGFKINATYAFAIYPVAFILHRGFMFFFRRMNYANGGNPEVVENIISKLATFTIIAFMCMGMWYGFGQFLMWFAEKNLQVSMGIFNWLDQAAASNPTPLIVVTQVVTILVYLGLIFKVLVLLWKKPPLESMESIVK